VTQKSHGTRAWVAISGAVITFTYVAIAAAALFEHLAGGEMSNEGAAGLSLLALLPALPLSAGVYWGVKAVGAASLFVPFNTGLANVLWIAAFSWPLALLQWSWAPPKLVRIFRSRG
jgi:hypothetical protein